MIDARDAHYAYFPDERSRSLFVAKCENAGFELRRLLSPMKPGSQPGVLFFHRDVPDQETMDRICSAIAALCDECGGEYDGWETQVVR
jgi:hypothetical protein